MTSNCSPSIVKPCIDPLVDRFGRRHTYLRIAITDRCNLRCVYCMPPWGTIWQEREDILSFEEIVRVVRLCAAMGVHKVRLTGGEPTVRRDLDVLIRQLAELPGIQTVAMTTNGVLLPSQAHRLRSSGLTALNVSLDTLDRDRFAAITLRDSFPEVMAGIEAALDAGFRPLKLNVVVMVGRNDDELLDFVEFVRGRPINIRFIEYMPFKGNDWNPHITLPSRNVIKRIQASYPLQRISHSADPHAPAMDFQIDGFCGTISVISPLSESFCQRCSRLRLTAEGAIKSCLFTPAEASVRQALQAGLSDAHVANIIREAIAQKPEAHPPGKEINTAHNLPMSLIGG